MHDYAYDNVPAAIGAGTKTLKLINAGPSVHEMGLARLQQGKTYADFLNWLQKGDFNAPPPVDFVSGSAAPFSPGHVEWIKEKLTPGEYVMACFVPDGQGKPHADDGMVAHFTVK